MRRYQPGFKKIKIYLTMLVIVGGLTSCKPQEQEGHDLNTTNGYYELQKSEFGGYRYEEARRNLVKVHTKVEVPNQEGVTRLAWTSCGGTLLSENQVLTAGHCLSEMNSNVLVPTSRVELSLFNGSKHVRVPVEKIIRHEQYKHERKYYKTKNGGKVASDRVYNDIAIVQFKERVEDYLWKVKLASSDFDKIKHNDKVVVAGYGKNPKLNQPDRKQGDWNWGIMLYDGMRELVAGTKKLIRLTKDPSLQQVSCRGDSGGPAFTIHNPGTKNEFLVQIGISSIGDIGCETNGSYLDLRLYGDWVKKHAPDAQFINPSQIAKMPKPKFQRPEHKVEKPKDVVVDAQPVFGNSDDTQGEDKRCEGSNCKAGGSQGATPPERDQRVCEELGDHHEVTWENCMKWSLQCGFNTTRGCYTLGAPQ